jgi:hypothetical protein
MRYSWRSEGRGLVRFGDLVILLLRVGAKEKRRMRWDTWSANSCPRILDFDPAGLERWLWNFIYADVFVAVEAESTHWVEKER